MSIESVMPSNHLNLCLSIILLPSIFPSIRVFSNESASGGQSIGASALASVLSMNTQGWFPLELIGLISLLSQKSSPTPQFESINSSALSLLYGPTLIAIPDYWKNHSFDYTDPCLCLLIHCLDLSQFFFQGASIFQFHGCGHHPQWFWSPGK